MPRSVLVYDEPVPAALPRTATQRSVVQIEPAESRRLRNWRAAVEKEKQRVLEAPSRASPDPESSDAYIYRVLHGTMQHTRHREKKEALPPLCKHGPVSMTAVKDHRVREAITRAIQEAHATRAKTSLDYFDEKTLNMTRRLQREADAARALMSSRQKGSHNPKGASGDATVGEACSEDSVCWEVQHHETLVRPPVSPPPETPSFVVSPVVHRPSNIRPSSSTPRAEVNRFLAAEAEVEKTLQQEREISAAAAAQRRRDRAKNQSVVVPSRVPPLSAIRAVDAQCRTTQAEDCRRDFNYWDCLTSLSAVRRRR